MTKKYKLNQGFIVQKLKDKTIIFSAERSIMFTLNESAGFIYNNLKLGRSEEKILNEYKERYNLDEKVAKADIGECLRDLVKKKILTLI